MKTDDGYISSAKAAVKTAMEKVDADAIPGGRDVMRKLYYQKHKGPHTEPYSGGFGEVRRWQQKKPSNKDPEKFDIVEKTDKNPVPIKKKVASGLKNEMLDHLKKKFPGDEYDDFDAEAAIYWFASDYHSGQSSELYSILSTSKFKPGPTHRSVKDEGETAKMMYSELKKTFKNAK